ncbi:MAG TPA: hypothetical protein VH682_23455 [Gemmataceae bacterium]|jgi:hypothetical protein
MTEDRTDPGWEDFARRHAGNAFLAHDALYALMEPIIDAIKASAPRFFSPQQELFERDLARTASFGFFYQLPLGSIGEPQREELGQASLEERELRTSQQIKELLGEEIRRAAASSYEIEEFFEGSVERRERVEDRQDAYAGWLVTNPDFHREARTLRERWEGVVRAIRRFPTLPVWFIPDVTADMDLPAGFREDFEAFYCRWNLETMQTWDWPAPMEPDFVGGLRKGIKLLSEAGMTLFIPWYMLRGSGSTFRTSPGSPGSAQSLSTSLTGSISGIPTEVTTLASCGTRTCCGSTASMCLCSCKGTAPPAKARLSGWTMRWRRC